MKSRLAFSLFVWALTSVMFAACLIAWGFDPSGEKEQRVWWSMFMATQVSVLHVIRDMGWLR